MTKKIQVLFDEEAKQALEDLQKETGAASVAEVVRDALGLYEWALEQVAQGYAVGAFRAGAPVKEVVIGRKLGRTRRAAAAKETDPEVSVSS